MTGAIDRAPHLGAAIGNTGRGLVVDQQYRLDLMGAILFQASLDGGGIDAGAPIARQRLHDKAQRAGDAAPVERE